MSIVNKWVRIVHRWLVLPLMAAVGSLIVLSIQLGENFVTPGWITVLGIGSILSLAVTGIYLFGLHYLSKARRAARARRTGKVLGME